MKNFTNISPIYSLSLAVYIFCHIGGMWGKRIICSALITSQLRSLKHNVQSNTELFMGKNCVWLIPCTTRTQLTSRVQMVNLFNGLPYANRQQQRNIEFSSTSEISYVKCALATSSLFLMEYLSNFCSSYRKIRGSQC